ncbi:uncharacterized protein LOC116849309 isoform X1 [Odontomachus brunneus]|uniref:uncharacterized protein LOC116849309 isoform X1 n=1 Tax=Odontomachus brunneus TaxID=486640 RepID=UPI0013F1D8C1|nr:uncharacterized protein LOC116849309 isoform X1 [Odontomachus brunneus]XP_032682218.1 uncharacterized protein LOC116849309 isoform X1 [Odontomachus brunneus]XP_032682219.1 uncharacterized protein LOC116849309 isoform X1 [Odontomachus brunneus]XP_032682220.1 uncharacterized protein LOC116849309 isoform X1 [Odontomachus brunneus]
MQPSHNLVVDGGGDFEYNKKIIVEDMLLHLHQIKYTFRNKPEVYYCLLDVINDFKSTSIDTLNIAQSQLYELLLEHFEAIMSFATFFSPSYETEEHLNHPEYDFEVSIVLHDLTETDIATLSLDQNIAARSSILIKRASCLHILQRLSPTNYSLRITIPNSILNKASSSSPLIPIYTGEMSDSHITDACPFQIPNQLSGITENRGQKRKRN